MLNTLINYKFLHQDTLNDEVAKYILSTYGTYNINSEQQNDVLLLISSIPYLLDLYVCIKQIPDPKKPIECLKNDVRKAIEYTLNLNA